ncbi:uncharacterized protein FMAN_15316 [Fusarium mangiferae]|uniref:JmjC domain-containing protein n=1 Tax=Fusarium mangiferae TaxID=192010 RepID=A0A1L7UHI2_FUSMA|nr:uncharacterized protein FMAN_15316 [Fusarium mangiferae]CVL07187.1 uncharacterized protein FMAN_15316 [Fusarium mangiferae]
MVPSKKRCETCNKYFNTHSWSKHTQKCRRCNICNDFCSAKKSLFNAHQALCGRDIGRGKHPCRKCGQAFKRRCNRDRHEKICLPCKDCGEWVTPGPTSRAIYRINCQSRLPRQSSESQPLNQLEAQAQSQGQIYSQIVPPVPAPAGDLIQSYRSKAEDAVSRMMAMIDARKNAKSGTRESEDYKSLHKYCRGVSVGRTMSASDYMDLSQSTKPQDSIIVCTMAEATEIFIKGPPTIPVLIVGTPNPRPLRIDTFLAWLTCRDTLHVHDFHRPSAKGRAPIALPSKDAKALLEARDKVSGPALNFLNLRGTKDDAGPECIKNMYDYKCIELSYADNGKIEAEVSVGDLDDSTRFQLLASTGAIHLPHIDRHGVFTTVLNEQGEKVWLIWPNLGFEVLKNWDEENKLPTAPIAIHIEEGSYLIQPPSTLHAPVTMKTCLMTGTMHWYSGHLLDITQATCIINEDEKITNEDISDQFIPKMAKLLKLWRENKAPCSWPPLDRYAEAMTALDNLREGCSCKARNVLCGSTSSCKCRKLGLPCFSQCHVNRRDCDNLI